LLNSENIDFTLVVMPEFTQ